MYLSQEKIMGQRNSYSRTGPCATFMRMKERSYENGQLKPGYNLQISTSDQYILNYGLYFNPTDTLTLPSHVEQMIEMYEHSPNKLGADAVYGSEENYEFLEKHKRLSRIIDYEQIDFFENTASSLSTVAKATLFESFFVFSKNL